MKPFLLLVARPPSLIKADELSALQLYGHLREQDLHTLDLLEGPHDMPDLNAYSGVFISGSPYDYLTPTSQKTPSQVLVEAQLHEICSELVNQDFPTLGLCYGLQALALAAGGTLTPDYSEDMQPMTISLTEAGRLDPLTSQLPETFLGYVAHTDSVGRAPSDMEVLASSVSCPVQIARIKKNIYGTQHHPEIDREGIAIRVEHYVGVYFSKEQHPAVLAAVQAVQTEQRLITHFAHKYGA